MPIQIPSKRKTPTRTPAQSLQDIDWDTMYTTRQAASLVGVPPQALNYWIYIGLLVPDQFFNNQHHFAPDSIARMRRIKANKDAGISIKQQLRNTTGQANPSRVSFSMPRPTKRALRLHIIKEQPSVSSTTPYRYYFGHYRISKPQPNCWILTHTTEPDSILLGPCKTYKALHNLIKAEHQFALDEWFGIEYPTNNP